MTAAPKRKIKDSVFSSLFADKANLVRMYKALHPEDDTVTEDDITNVTIQNTLVDTIYNDLGFMVRGKMILLIEAQSSWSINIVIRMLMYLMQEYQDYIKANNLNLYGTRKIELPVPELYVIYTGDKQNVPAIISVRKDLFGGQQVPFDAEVTVITDGQKGTIIYEYVTFTKVYNEQYRLYGATKQTVEETLRICKDRNILRDYLSKHETEVVDIMMLLFDDEYNAKAYGAERYKDGMAQGLLSSLKNLMENLKMSFEQATAALGIPQSEQAKYAEMLKEIQ